MFPGPMEGEMCSNARASRADIHTFSKRYDLEHEVWVWGWSLFEGEPPVGSKAEADMVEGRSQKWRVIDFLAGPLDPGLPASAVDVFY